jgi:YebC/PmpR family DNA-binding regulatory protein
MLGGNGMSGHSKFANIKHKKEKADAQKGKIFTKIGREIAVAVKEGGSDPSNNSKLRDVIAKAKSNNMPNDTIDRSIKKAAGDASGVIYESITYEGYGPSGVAIIVEVLTDNKNRTAANVRHAFSRGGGNMGTTGCVSFMFDKKGQIIVEKSDDIDEDELMMLALDSGAEDFNAEEEGYEILTSPEDFSAVREALENAGINMSSAEIAMIPQTMTELTNDQDIKKMRTLLDILEEDDDVQDVYHNWDEPDEE